MSIEVMKQALEATEGDLSLFNIPATARMLEAITALRTAIAESEKQEPVAWGCNRYIEDDNGFQIGTDEPELAWGKYAPDDNGWWPLYTAPPQQEKQEPVACQYAVDVAMPEYRCVGKCQYTAPSQRQPLTEEEIIEHFKARVDTGSLLSFADGVRFAERKHGIGGEHD